MTFFDIEKVMGMVILLNKNSTCSIMEHMGDDGKQCNYTKQLDCALNKIKIWQEMYIVMAINTIVANAVCSLVISSKINLQLR